MRISHSQFYIKFNIIIRFKNVIFQLQYTHMEYQPNYTVKINGEDIMGIHLVKKKRRIEICIRLTIRYYIYSTSFKTQFQIVF